MLKTSIEKLVIKSGKSLLSALKKIEDGGIQSIFVVDEAGCLVGMATDGDIRRSLISNQDLSRSISEVMNKSPHSIQEDFPSWNIKKYMMDNEIRQLPILDEEGKLLDIKILDIFQADELENKVVLMAGGLGSRLGNLTVDCPKPLLPVGGKPIIDSIVESFKEQGFYNFHLCLNYLADHFKRHFEDGQKHGINIDYTLEEKRLGTSGALALMERPAEAFFVINADLLTNFNYAEILNYHKESGSQATMCVREYETIVPYGVVNEENGAITSIVEKPSQIHLINTGVYILDPDVIDYIPKNSYFDMIDLFQVLIEKGINIQTFSVRGYWLDVGRSHDYQKAQTDFHKEK